MFFFHFWEKYKLSSVKSGKYGVFKGDMQRFFHKIDEKVVYSCLLQYKPICVINFDKLRRKIL